MRLNEKGFTVIELALSFIFVTLISIGMYQLVTNYKEKEQLESIRSELITFKTDVIVDIEQDINKYFLKDISYCTDGENIVNRCIELTFGNNTTKRLSIEEEQIVDELEWGNGEGSDFFTYTVPYLRYGEMKYSIPDAKYVSIRADYMFTKTTPEDSLENKTALYKINIPIQHEDFDETFDISIVATGSTNLEVTPKYKEYAVGTRLLIQVNDTLHRWFRVILKSSAYDKNITLLYDDTQLGNSNFYPDQKSGNKYSGSFIELALEDYTKRWVSPTQIRLLTAEEVAYMANTCPRYKDGGVSTLTINKDSSKSWLYSYSYWTQTPYAGNTPASNYTGWYINSNGTMTTSTVDKSYAVRPVIVVDKEYILQEG